MSLTRRGLGLLEMLIALSLTGLLALLAWTILERSAFRLRDRSERIAMEHSLRVASSVVRSLLEPLGHDSTAGSDLALVAPDAFVARVVRASGVLCGAGPDTLLLRDGVPWWTEIRAPVPGRDSVLVGTVFGAERWAAAALSSVPRAGSCPDGTPAVLLPVGLAPLDLAAIGPGSPVRVFEPMELRAYSSGGAQWLGMRSLSSAGTIQPLAGPLLGTGVTFRYFARGGGAESIAGSVARVGVEISGITERAGGVGVARVAQARTDSAVGAVLLRNVP
jgi:hypothetical protein